MREYYAGCTLECIRCISQSKMHGLPLELSAVTDECRFIDVLFGDGYLPVTAIESNVVNHFAFPKLSRQSSIRGSGYRSLTVRFLRRRQSMQNRFLLVRCTIQPGQPMEIGLILSHRPPGVPRRVPQLFSCFSGQPNMVVSAVDGR